MNNHMITPEDRMPKTHIVIYSDQPSKDACPDCKGWDTITESPGPGILIGKVCTNCFGTGAQD